MCPLRNRGCRNPVALRVARFERVHGGAFEHAPVDVETRAVAGAVPAAFGGVEVDEAPEVRAAQRDGVQGAVLVTEDALFPESVADDARLSLERQTASRRYRLVADEVRSGLRVELGEAGRRAQRQAVGIQARRP